MSSRRTDVMPEFSDWCHRLWIAVRSLGDSQFVGSVMVDAAIPYRLGWSPDRAARAICRLAYSDYRILVTIVREEEMEARRAEGR